MSKSNPSDTWANLLQSDNPSPAKEGPSTWDRVATALAGVGTFASGFAAEQIHSAGQDVVSRVLLGESFSPEPAKAPEPDREKDNAKDMDLDR